MKQILLIVVGVLWVTWHTTGAFADCHVRLSPRPIDVSHLGDEIKYLHDTISGFSQIRREDATDAINFYLPRMRNAESLIVDLHYALNTLDHEPKREWNDDLRYELIRVFTSLQDNRVQRIRYGNLPPPELIQFFMAYSDDYQDLLDHMLQGYHYAFFFGPCPWASPYVFFANIAGHLAIEAGARTTSDHNALNGIGIRRLYGSVPFSRNLYQLDETGVAKYTKVIPPCTELTDIPIVAHFEYLPEDQNWQQMDYFKRKGREFDPWFSPLPDSDDGDTVRNEWNVFTDSLYAQYQDKIRSEFIEKLRQSGITVGLPDYEIEECK